MGKDMKNASLRGEDLSWDPQATKAKQAFLDMPREVLIKLVDQMAEIFSEHFTLENFQCPNSEKLSHYAKLFRIQNLMICIQTRTVQSEDEVDKLVRKTTKQRPRDLDEVRQQEIGLRTQTQLLELA